MTSPAIASGPSFRHAVVIFAVAGLAAYFNSFQGAFVFDDLAAVVDSNIGKPLQGRLAGRPVVSLSFTLNYWLDQFNPRGYHLANLVIHVLAAVTLFDLTRRTLVLPRFRDRYTHSAAWLAFAVAIVWLVHPLNTQAVTYIVQRCESLMGLFFLLSLWCYLRGATAERGTGWFALAGAACVLASGCKELTLALPILAVLYDRTFLADSWRETRTRWKPLAALCIGPLLGIALMLWLGFLTDKGGTVGFGVPRFTSISYAFTQADVISHYLYLSIWPRHLCIDYLDWPIRTAADVWPQLIGLGIGLFTTGYGVARRTAWGFLAAWFFVILAPTSSVIPIQDAAFEHRMYLPLIVIVTFVVFGTHRLLELLRTGVRPWVGGLLLGSVVAALVVRTIVRNEDYASVGKLFLNAIEQRPENSRSRMIYAGALLRSGQAAAALEHAKAAMRRPDLIADFTILGECYQELGQTAEAERILREVVAAKPDDARRNFALAVVLLQNGKPAEAEPFARRATPEVNGRILLANCLREQGREDEAAATFAEARRIAPDGYRHALMTSARRAALDPSATPLQVRKALLNAISAVQLNETDDWEEWDTLAICHARSGQFAAAVIAVERALAASPNDYERAWLTERLQLFRAKKPYLQPGGK